MMMTRSLVLLLLLLSVGLACGARVRTVKEQAKSGASALGLSPADLATLKQLKSDGRPFTCDGGATTLDWALVNDDYCDCGDGGDEPGTSACAGRSGSPGFYCRNVGHVPKVVPASFVNDGVCDCCDGSDERLTGVCQSSCLDEYEQQRSDKQRQQQMHEQGTMVLRSWLRQSGEQLAEQRAQLAVLEQQRAAAQARLDDAIAADREATRLGSVAQPREDDSGDEDDAVDPALIAHLSPIDDEDDFLRQLVQSKSTVDDAVDEDEDDDEDDDDNDNDEEEEEEEERRRRSAVGGESPHVRQLREHVAELQRKIDDYKNVLELDFGPGDVFYMLYDKTFSLRSDSYTYSISMYKEAKQDGTNIGRFARLIADDAGRFSMSFANGQTCWQGPARSATVEFRCGVETRLVSVEEVSKCTYRAVVEACVACSLDQARLIADEIQRLDAEVAAAQRNADEFL